MPKMKHSAGVGELAKIIFFQRLRFVLKLSSNMAVLLTKQGSVKISWERVFPSTHLVADIGSSHPTKSKIQTVDLLLSLKDIHDFLKVSTPDKPLSHPT